MTSVRHESPVGVPLPRGAWSVLSSARILPSVVICAVAGQVGELPDGTLAGPDLRTQSQRAFVNVVVALGSVGGTLADVLTMTTFLVDGSDLGEFTSVRDSVMGEFAPRGAPAHTLVFVSRLARPGPLVEIQALAVITATP